MGSQYWLSHRKQKLAAHWQHTERILHHTTKVQQHLKWRCKLLTEMSKLLSHIRTHRFQTSKQNQFRTKRKDYYERDVTCQQQQPSFMITIAVRRVLQVFIEPRAFDSRSYFFVFVHPAMNANRPCTYCKQCSRYIYVRTKRRRELPFSLMSRFLFFSSFIFISRTLV